MKNLSWQQTIKLGKVEVLRRLQELNITFPTKLQYFKLCSLLYKALQSNVVSLAAKRVEKAQKKVASATNPFDLLDAIFEESQATMATYLI